MYNSYYLVWKKIILLHCNSKVAQPDAPATIHKGIIQETQNFFIKLKQDKPLPQTTRAHGQWCPFQSAHGKRET